MFDADADRRVDGGTVRVDAHIVRNGRVRNDEELVCAGERGIERVGLREVAMPHFDA